MIERLRESEARAFGFKVIGKLTAEEMKAFEPQLESAIGSRGRKTLGILADLSEMQGAQWAARWEETGSREFLDSEPTTEDLSREPLAAPVGSSSAAQTVRIYFSAAS